MTAAAWMNVCFMVRWVILIISNASTEWFLFAPVYPDLNRLTSERQNVWPQTHSCTSAVNVDLKVSNDADLRFSYEFNKFDRISHPRPSLRSLKGHSQLWDRANLDTSFLTSKKVHPNLKSKNIYKSASIFAVFFFIFNSSLKNLFLSVLLVILWFYLYLGCMVAGVSVICK